MPTSSGDAPSGHRSTHPPAHGESGRSQPRPSGGRDAAAAWIYGGVWAAIVALFRVPPQAPTLPTAGEHVRSIRPARGYLQYLKFFFWLLLLPGDVIPIGGWIAIYLALPPLGLLLLPVLAAAVVLPDLVAYVGIHLRYDTTWYVLTDRSLRIRRGILIIRETTVSFENVQNVEVRQGPVQRHFGIADLVVQTAGGGAAHSEGHGHGSSGRNLHIAILQGLDDAPAVRDAILEHIRRLRSGGLGDEPLAQPASPVMEQGGALSPAHVAVLREIRGVVARMAG
jgi:membrane protein YdbS with pleckstrin-like domain